MLSLSPWRRNSDAVLSLLMSSQGTSVVRLSLYPPGETDTLKELLCMLTTWMSTEQCIAPSNRYGVKAILKGNLYSGLKNSNPGLRRTPNDIPCRDKAEKQEMMTSLETSSSKESWASMLISWVEAPSSRLLLPFLHQSLLLHQNCCSFGYRQKYLSNRDKLLYIILYDECEKHFTRLIWRKRSTQIVITFFFLFFSFFVHSSTPMTPSKFLTSKVPCAL